LEADAQGVRPLNAVLGALAKLSPVSRYAVEGGSMAPAYRDGERVLVNRAVYRLRAPATGEVVVLHDPEQPERLLLKRIAASDAMTPGRYYVLGDNAVESRDSRHFGPVARADVIGRAWFKY